MDICGQETRSSDAMYCGVTVANVRAAKEKLGKAEGWPPRLVLYLNAHWCLFCCFSLHPFCQRSYSAVAKQGYSWCFGQMYCESSF